MHTSLSALAYGASTSLRPTEGGFAVYCPHDTGLRWLDDGAGGWIGQGKDIEGMHWLPDGQGGFTGHGPSITGLHWCSDGEGGFVGSTGVIEGMRRIPDGRGGFDTIPALDDTNRRCSPAFSLTALPDVGDRVHELTVKHREGTWGGPVYAYRGAEIWTNGDGTEWQLWIDDHPLRGLTLRRFARALDLADGWIDYGGVPAPRKWRTLEVPSGRYAPVER